VGIDTRELLDKLLDSVDLSEAEAGSLMHELAGGEMEPGRAGALLAALRIKGETPAEIRGLANVMRELAVKPIIPMLAAAHAADCVGTGGDASGSLNLSTGTALLAAACGIPMVKHGNRSVSSRSGSADVLEALGTTLPDSAEAASECLNACNFSFLFAPVFHPAMKNIAPVRAAMGVRTVFNILGPLTNPAEPPFHLIGAFSTNMAKLMAETLSGMNIRRAFVVHGEPGWDEATPVGRFELFDVMPGKVHRERRDPRDYGISRCDADDLKGGDAEFNARALEDVLRGRDTGPHRDALLLGAALLLEVTGEAQGVPDGLARARDVLDSGAAFSLVEKLRKFNGRRG